MLLMLEIAARVCLGIVAAYFLLRTAIGAVTLGLMILGAILGVTVLLLWVFWTPIMEIARPLAGVIAFLVILAWLWAGIEPLGKMLAPLLPPPFGIKGKPGATAPDAQGEAGERHDDRALPR